jgi:AcrR family transcriptional regulator/DNA-binding MarR family transcriptional regulator
MSVATVPRSRGRVRVQAPRARVVEIQRSRLLTAALGAVDEIGYSRTTVAHITGRARVSRRTFYDLFDNREDCLLAALESVVELIGDELLAAELDGLSWRERVRMGLWTILSFLDREPVLARVCVVQALRGGPRVLERREQVLAGLAREIDRGREESEKANASPPLVAEGLVGAAFAIVYGRLLRGEPGALGELHGELMGMIVLPYLGPGVAARERRRGTGTFSSGRKMPAGLKSPARLADDLPGDSTTFTTDPLATLPMRLTYRTARVLETIAEQPGVSNRLVGEHAGVSDQGQISKLLARLERLGLIENAGEGQRAGEANAWRLTGTGERVAQSIRAHSPEGDQEAGS